MTINQVHKLIRKHIAASGLPLLPKTSVISPLYPGQFCYCLDERQWLVKFNNGFVEVKGHDSFQKIQPCIRMADFEHYFENNNPDTQHLTSFTISTMSGGHAHETMSKDEERDLYRKMVQEMLGFLTQDIGLDPHKMRVSYFSGGVTPRCVEKSRKRNDQDIKILVGHELLPADELAIETLLEAGLTEDQIIPCFTRDNFLTSNWCHYPAPWGFRNEFFYQLPDGSWLDIATIERLVMTPVYEERDGTTVLTHAKPWDARIIISGLGLERLSLASSGSSNIHDLPEFRRMRSAGCNETQLEALRILHRVYTDATWEEITSKQRREKIGRLTKILDPLPLRTIAETLALHAGIYERIFPDLKEGAHKCLREIAAQKARQVLAKV